MDDEAKLKQLRMQDIRSLEGPARQRALRRLKNLREKVQNQDSPSEKRGWRNVMETLNSRPRKKRRT